MKSIGSLTRFLGGIQKRFSVRGLTDVPPCGAAGRACPAQISAVAITSAKAMRSAVIVFASMIAIGAAPGSRADTIICVPSAKTVQPCPGGYAPSQITVEATQAPDSYQSPFESMPAQEMILAVSIVFGGLLGFAVGVKLL